MMIMLQLPPSITVLDYNEFANQFLHGGLFIRGLLL
jgi:hypothetical protein